MSRYQSIKKILICGLGSIGQRHLRNTRRLLGDNVTILAHRHSRKSPMLDEARQIVEGGNLAETYNLVEFDNLSDALLQEPDVLFVCNPSSEHLNTAMAGATHNCHLFVEKPLAISLAGVPSLTDEVERNNLIAMVAYQMRFHPGLLKVKEWLDDARIGNLVSANIVHGEHLANFHPYESYKDFYAGQKSLGGGVVLTQIHEINYAVWLFGMPDTVYAIGGALSSLEIDVEDSVSMLLKYRNSNGDFPVNISVDYLQKPARRETIIVGDEGRIQLDFYGKRLALMENWLKGECEEEQFTNLEINDLFLKELECFFNAVERHEKVPTDLRGGMLDLQIADLVRESMDSGEVLSVGK